MQSMLSRLPTKKFIKFVVVGGSGALLQLGLATLFVNILKDLITRIDTVVVLGYPFEIEYYIIVSLTIAILMVTVWNFTWNLRWTFKQGRPND